MRLPAPSPKQSNEFNIPKVCKIPTTEQLPPPVEHNHYVNEPGGQFSVAGFETFIDDHTKKRRAAKKTKKPKPNKQRKQVRSTAPRAANNEPWQVASNAGPEHFSFWVKAECIGMPFIQEVVFEGSAAPIGNVSAHDRAPEPTPIPVRAARKRANRVANPKPAIEAASRLSKQVRAQNPKSKGGKMLRELMDEMRACILPARTRNQNN